MMANRLKAAKRTQMLEVSLMDWILLRNYRACPLRAPSWFASFENNMSSLKFGEKNRKNTENSEKYFGKFGKILGKIRKNTPENSEKYF